MPRGLEFDWAKIFEEDVMILGRGVSHESGVDR